MRAKEIDYCAGCKQLKELVMTQAGRFEGTLKKTETGFTIRFISPEIKLPEFVTYCPCNEDFGYWYSDWISVLTIAGEILKSVRLKESGTKDEKPNLDVSEYYQWCGTAGRIRRVRDGYVIGWLYDSKLKADSENIRGGEHAQSR